MRNILVYILAVLVLLGSTGLMVDHHFCQGELQHSTLMKKAPSCHETQSCHQSEIDTEKACCKKNSSHKDEEGCCDNESSFVQVDLDYPCFDLAEEVESSQMIAFSNTGVRSLPTLISITGVRFINHIPPPRLLDPQSFLQVFRC